LSLPHVEEGLAEVAAEIQVCPDVEGLGGHVPAVIEALAQLPAALPGFLVSIGGPRAIEDALPMDGAEVGQRVAQRPAFLEGGAESCDLPVLLGARTERVVCVIVLVVLGIAFGLDDFCVFRVSRPPGGEPRPERLTFQAADAAGADSGWVVEDLLKVLRLGRRSFERVPYGLDVGGDGRWGSKGRRLRTRYVSRDDSR